jgi:hypothetical protein
MAEDHAAKVIAEALNFTPVGRIAESLGHGKKLRFASLAQIRTILDWFQVLQHKTILRQDIADSTVTSNAY